WSGQTSPVAHGTAAGAGAAASAVAASSATSWGSTIAGSQTRARSVIMTTRSGGDDHSVWCGCRPVGSTAWSGRRMVGVTSIPAVRVRGRHTDVLGAVLRTAGWTVVPDGPADAEVTGHADGIRAQCAGTTSWLADQAQL